MGNNCSCVFSEVPSVRKTEFKLPSSPAKSPQALSPLANSVSVNDCDPITTFQSEVFQLPALNHLYQFYSRTSHRIPEKVIKLQRTLPILYFDSEDMFELPVEIDEDVFYFGQWEGDVRQGKGVQINLDGSIYSGFFELGKYSGQGRLIFCNGEYYEGGFKNGKQHGEGCHYISKHKCVKGKYSKGKIKGICTIVWDSATYTGQFEQGFRNGIGKLVQTEKTFEGEFVNDLIQGYGCCTWANGKKYSGQWEKNKMHGFGVFEWPDGRIYEGNYKEGIKNGEGKMTWPDGKVYNGQWENGMQHGEAEYTFFNKKKGQMMTRNGRWEKGERIEWISY